MSRREILLYGVLGLAIITGLIGFTTLPDHRADAPNGADMAIDPAPTEHACRMWSLTIAQASVGTFVAEVTGLVAADQSAGGLPGEVFTESLDFDHADEVLLEVFRAAATAGSIPGVEDPAFAAFQSVIDAAAQLRSDLAFRTGIDRSVIRRVGDDATALADRVHDAMSVCGLAG